MAAFDVGLRADHSIVRASSIGCLKPRHTQRVVAGFTYIFTGNLAALGPGLNMLSRRIVGWSISETMHAQLVTNA